MKLSHFNDKICKNITEIMPSIKAVYQMEQEFHPYLDINFLTNIQHNEKYTGIILQTKNETIKEYSDFNTKQDVDNLRDLIWKYLLKEKSIKQVDISEQNNDRLVKPNRVIQGWANIVKEHKDHVFPPISELYLPLPKYNPIFIKNPDDIQTRKTCKEMRYQECTDNYVPHTYEFGRCMDEVNLLCNTAYPNEYINYKEGFESNHKSSFLILIIIFIFIALVYHYTKN
jgi:hypothetical protein